MKILIVNASDIQDGAAKAAHRLYSALLAEGVSCQMLVQSKYTKDVNVLGPKTRFMRFVSKARPIIDAWFVRKYRSKDTTLFSANSTPCSDVVSRINRTDADVVHLHWVNAGMLTIEDIAKINKPIVWTMHDMWGFSGGCHYSQTCIGYESNCGECLVLNSGKQNDLSRKTFERKEKTFAKIKKMTIVGVSHWLANCARQSVLFRNYSVLQLPNLIDTRRFAPFSKKQARFAFNLPENKKIILFGAIAATSDPRKGFYLLHQALNQLKDEDTELVVFGSNQTNEDLVFSQKVHYVGYLNDDISLSVLYSAADVMVVPSIQEAFGQTAAESMSCGTPVVAFAATGLLDIVDHKINGYLAKPYDPADLAEGIAWVLNTEQYSMLSHKAREKVMHAFDSTQVVKEYIDLYKRILDESEKQV
jgi:glycosyltransferase involved in cell wall biosynthesis